MVKEMTVGDRIRARHCHQDFWEFTPTHKLWLAANHGPTIRGTDWASPWGKFAGGSFHVRVAVVAELPRGLDGSFRGTGRAGTEAFSTSNRLKVTRSSYPARRSGLGRASCGSDL